MNCKNEIWKPVKDYDGLYEISNLGRLKKLSYTYNSPFLGIVEVKEKIISGAKKDGYRQALLFKDGKSKFKMIHRLVAIAFLKYDKNRLFINHKNLIKNDNRVENLEWVTTQENIIHAHSFGHIVMPKGDKSVNSKISEKDVNYIRKNKDNKTQIDLSKQFNISQSLISKIINNKRRNT
jgi:hypothetical protein